MPAGIGTIQVKTRKGHPTVMGMGKTPRGQNYLKVLKPLAVKDVSDPAFKAELEAAIKEMLA